MIEAVKRLRLFLEGIECPVISANVTCNIGSSASASIAIIATPEMLNIPPRTCVHLFFLEDIAVSLESEYKNTLDLASDKRYRLLFVGELHAISYTKNASGGINGTLECRDHYENYNRAYVYYSDKVSSNATNNSSTRYIYSGALVQNNYISFNAGQVLNDAFQNPNPLTPGYQEATGLLASIIHILERFTGFMDAEGKIEIMGYSTFQTLQQLRLRILQQLGIYSNDTFAAKLMGADFLINMIKNIFKIEGGLLTVSQIVDEIMNVIYYARVSNSCAYGVKINDSLKVGNSARTEAIEYILSITTSGVTDVTIPSAYDLSQDKNTYPITWFGLSQEAYQRVIGSKDIRVWKDMLNKPFNSPNTQAQITLQTLINKLESNGSDKEVQSRLEQLTEILQAINNRTVIYQELVNKTFQVGGSAYYKMFDEIKDDVQDEVVEGGKILKTTMLIPDLFWAVAPTCNVIFPNMYETFTINSSLTDQATRLTLQASNEFLRDDVTTKFFFAPSLVPVQALTKDKVADKAKVAEFLSATERGKRYDGYLLDHELFTGIVPEFATKDIFKFLVADNGLNKDEDNFLERTTDYLYVQTRLSKSTISINGIFNPYVAVGFPCVVFDRYSTTDTGSEVLGSVSNHYVGLVSLVSHSLDQSSATTSYSISYARRHKDDSILLGTTNKVGLGENTFDLTLQEPLESRIEPLWLDRNYRSDRIGEEVYEELLGVKSIVDDANLEKTYSKFEDGSKYASQELAIENLEKKILSTKMSSNGSVGKFTRSYIYREIATLDFVLGQNPFHSFDASLETAQQVFSVCPVNFAAPISSAPHSSSAPVNPAVNIQELRKDLVRKYVESIHNRGIPL